jgi:hypothetical protein
MKILHVFSPLGAEFSTVDSRFIPPIVAKELENSPVWPHANNLPFGWRPEKKYGRCSWKNFSTKKAQRETTQQNCPEGIFIS